jgi:hypothetical protein
MKIFTFLLILTITVSNLPAQSTSITPQTITSKKDKKGIFYFSWGYNRDRFSSSDIHFKNTSGDYNPVTGNNDSYDFIIYNAKAKDRPGLNNILKTDLTIPQYNYRLGYYLNDERNFGFEINFDHVKYIMRDWQTLHIKGKIFDQEIDKDTLISPENFLHFEHSDGANFLMLNFVIEVR